MLVVQPLHDNFGFLKNTTQRIELCLGMAFGEQQAYLFPKAPNPLV